MNAGPCVFTQTHTCIKNSMFNNSKTHARTHTHARTRAHTHTLVIQNVSFLNMSCKLQHWHICVCVCVCVCVCLFVCGVDHYNQGFRGTWAQRKCVDLSAIVISVLVGGLWTLMEQILQPPKLRAHSRGLWYCLELCVWDAADIPRDVCHLRDTCTFL